MPGLTAHVGARRERVEQLEVCSFHRPDELVELDLDRGTVLRSLRTANVSFVA